MANRYTEGILGDAVAILDNGEPISVSEILRRLNMLDDSPSEKEIIESSTGVHELMDTELSYWKRRCIAAEKIISKRVSKDINDDDTQYWEYLKSCDPDSQFMQAFRGSLLNENVQNNDRI